MRLSDFWRRMDAAFGSVYAQSLALDYVFASLGGRTVRESIAAGVPTADIWRAVCKEYEVPAQLR